jgi:two-component system response regulator AtoC
MANILIIEDEENLRFTVARSLRAAGHEVVEAESCTQADELLESQAFQAILTDVNLGSQNGIDLVERLRADGFDGAIIVMTGFGTVESAVRAMKVGADDYIQKPVRLDELSLLLERTLAARGDRRRLRLYQRLEQASSDSSAIIGQSQSWKDTLTLAERLARVPIATRIDAGANGSPLATILLLGETGVGKGVLARHIHETAQRLTGVSGAPFVHINCSALPASLIESELFGHEKGAFTDARAAREGLFEMADGGTIFLDEIGDMLLELQAKLLTVLERGIVRRVGGSREISVRVRVIAATNQDLERRAADGTFRRDLLYRLNAFTVRIPALREREDDAATIAQTTLARLAREYGRPDVRLSPDAIDAIRAHTWPGNVREVLNAMQRVAMLSENELVRAEDLGLVQAADPLEVSNDREPDRTGTTELAGLTFDFESASCTFTDVERELMKQALAKTRGNVSRAAKLIGMQRSSFRYRIERYGLESFVREVSQ